MKCPRPIGLVLVTILSLAYSMPTETTTTTSTRYNFEGFDRFPSDTVQNSDKNIFLSSTNLGTSHIFTPLYLSDITDQRRNSKQLRLDNDIFLNKTSQLDKFNDSIVQGRKLIRKPSKNVLSNTLPKNNTLRVTTINKLPVRVKNTQTISTNKTHTLKLPARKNSTILVNVKNGVSVVKTKDPFKLRVTKLTTKTPSKIIYTSPTSAPIRIKLTKFTTHRPTTSPTKSIINVTPSKSRPSIATTVSSKKKKPTVHKIVTKWSDDLSEIKQDWYEEGVPYPNPNPEISSFSPPISLNQLSTISPLSSDFIDSVNYPSLNPEISSYSPPVSLSSVSPISDIVNNFNYPTPNPEITSYSPPVSLNSISPLGDSVAPVSSYSTPSSATTDVSPFNVFNLDMVPDRTKDAAGGGSPCPSIHISSSVLSRQQRQECSDLNLVINSHFHQNQNAGGTRNPAVNAYDAVEEAPVAPVEDIPLEEEGQALTGGGLADPGVAADPGLADAGVASDPGVAADPGLANTGGALPQAVSPPGGGTGGTGGTGGEGGAGDNGGGLKFPDLKPLFELIGYLWNKLGHLLSFLKNPYLYIIPMALFFALGFFTILALFPWWIPLLLLYLGIKSHKKPKDTVTFYKHVHRPVHHPDGWFWNHQTKTWQNVQDFVHKRNDDNRRIDDVSDLIKKIRNKYENDTSIHTWKRRRRTK